MLLWIESQPTSVIALIVFGAAYLSAALIFCLAAFFSRHPIAKACSRSHRAFCRRLERFWAS